VAAQEADVELALLRHGEDPGDQRLLVAEAVQRRARHRLRRLRPLVERGEIAQAKDAAARAAHDDGDVDRRLANELAEVVDAGEVRGRVRVVGMGLQLPARVDLELAQEVVAVRADRLDHGVHAGRGLARLVDRDRAEAGVDVDRLVEAAEHLEGALGQREGPARREVEAPSQLGPEGQVEQQPRDQRRERGRDEHVEPDRDPPAAREGLALAHRHRCDSRLRVVQNRKTTLIRT
jgi:hypothetical protein